MSKHPREKPEKPKEVIRFCKRTCFPQIFSQSETPIFDLTKKLDYCQGIYKVCQQDTVLVSAIQNACAVEFKQTPAVSPMNIDKVKRELSDLIEFPMEILEYKNRLQPASAID